MPPKSGKRKAPPSSSAAANNKRARTAHAASPPAREVSASPAATQQADADPELLARIEREMRERVREVEDLERDNARLKTAYDEMKLKRDKVVGTLDDVKEELVVANAKIEGLKEELALDENELREDLRVSDWELERTEEVRLVAVERDLDAAKREVDAKQIGIVGRDERIVMLGENVQALTEMIGEYEAFGKREREEAQRWYEEVEGLREELGREVDRNETLRGGVESVKRGPVQKIDGRWD